MARYKREPETAEQVMETVAEAEAFFMPHCEGLDLAALARLAMVRQFGEPAVRTRERYIKEWCTYLGTQPLNFYEQTVLVVSDRATGRTITLTLFLPSMVIATPTPMTLFLKDFERLAPGVYDAVRAEAARRKDVSRIIDLAANTLEAPIRKVCAAVSPVYRGLTDMPVATPVFTKKLYIRGMTFRQAEKVENWFAEAVLAGKREKEHERNRIRTEDHIVAMQV